jgi:hypothetical protein
MLRATKRSMIATARSRFAIVAALPVSLLLAALSLGGLLSSAYAREAPAWSAQAIGQDWFDLSIAAPLVAISGLLARRGSYPWSVMLAGAYAYTVYEALIYAFAIHFNALFLVYCATLGLAGFALIALAIDLSRRVERIDRRGAHLAGGLLVTVGALFALLWLAEDVPAVIRNTPSQTLVETGLFTSPVHVIDLAFVLPAHVLAGVWVWRRHKIGELLAPIVLAFTFLMAASIGGMMVVMRLNGFEAAAPVTIAMFVIAAITVVVLARVLRVPQRVAEKVHRGADEDRTRLTYWETTSERH